jgi:hypothetical protein
MPTAVPASLCVRPRALRTSTVLPPVVLQRCQGDSQAAGNDFPLCFLHLQLKQEVESLLQRTDSILSRSSGHSTLHGAPASHLPG